jgi:hypothetical protein
MLTETLTYTTQWQHTTIEKIPQEKVNIVFIFGEREIIKKSIVYEEIKALYPKADIIGCSSSGNILDDELSSASLVATAVSFEQGSVQVSIKDFDEGDDLLKVSNEVVNGLSKEGLKHIFILSEGLNMNGSSLAQGANYAVESKIAVTGGLAGDGTNFQETWVIANEKAKQNRVVAVGFYGDSLSIESACYGGWNEFGMLRKITKSKDNIVYKIDGKPALALYKKYLGEYAKDLADGSALDFPMNIRANVDDTPITRSVLSVDEERQSLIFAGDVPEGSFAKLMRTSVDDLIDGSETAAKQIRKINDKTALGLVVSCVGRRLVLKQLTDEELEIIKDTLGENINLVGFYSYGELAPFSNELLSCKLHNQTMTLTAIYED